MGFHVNDNSQYLYWPRSSDGSLDITRDPPYSVYPAIHVKTINGQNLSRVLSDKDIYSADYRDCYDFSITEDSLEMRFSQKNTDLFDSRWDFVHGFKYTLDDQLFHMITEIKCKDRPFQDIGLTYEIIQNPLSTIKLKETVISNSTRSLVRTTNETWNANDILENIEPVIEIISDNEEKFIFNFEDMKDAGFSRYCLNYKEESADYNSPEKAIGAGMDGYGYYTPDTWIKIDPTFHDDASDKYDLYNNLGIWYTTQSSFKVGRNYVNNYFPFVAFDTGITRKIQSNTSDAGLELKIFYSTMESNDGMDIRVYNVKGNENSNQAREDSTSFSDTYYSHTLTSALMGPQGGWVNVSIDSLTDYWKWGSYFKELGRGHVRTALQYCS